MGQPQRQQRVTELAALPPEVSSFSTTNGSLSAHIARRRSLMMDGGEGRAVGSHICMDGKAFGLALHLKEVVIGRTQPTSKAWQTIDSDLVVIGDYTMGFDVEPLGGGSRLRVWIDYQWPSAHPALGRLGGRLYARWCVKRMSAAASGRFPAM